jgi:tetratricopeptide (TPR) repeat protein
VPKAEIALGIGRALQVMVGAEEGLPHQPTENRAAYNLYLQGRYAFDRFDHDGFILAASYFQQATDLDPKFGRAFGVLGATRIMQAWYGYIPRDQGFSEGRDLSIKAISLDPTIPEAPAMLALVDTIYSFDWAAAKREVDKALQLQPNNPISLAVAAQFEASLGHWEEASNYMTRSLAVDPLEPSAIITHGEIEYRAGHFDKAEALIRRGLAVAPTYVGAHYILTKSLVARHQFGDALSAAKLEQPEAGRDAGIAVASRALGRKADSVAALARFTADYGSDSPFALAQVLSYLGQSDAAFTALDQALEQRDPDLHNIKGEHLFENLRADARYVAFLRRMNLPDWHRQRLM